MLNPLDGKYITQVFNLVLVALIIYLFHEMVCTLGV